MRTTMLLLLLLLLVLLMMTLTLMLRMLRMIMINDVHFLFLTQVLYQEQLDAHKWTYKPTTVHYWPYNQKITNF